VVVQASTPLNNRKRTPVKTSTNDKEKPPLRRLFDLVFNSAVSVRPNRETHPIRRRETKRTSDRPARSCAHWRANRSDKWAVLFSGRGRLSLHCVELAWVMFQAERMRVRAQGVPGGSLALSLKFASKEKARAPG